MMLSTSRRRYLVLVSPSKMQHALLEKERERDNDESLKEPFVIVINGTEGKRKLESRTLSLRLDNYRRVPSNNALSFNHFYSVKNLSTNDSFIVD